MVDERMDSAGLNSGAAVGLWTCSVPRDDVPDAVRFNDLSEDRAADCPALGLRDRMSRAPFEAILSEHKRMVYGIALHCTGEASVANEVAQDVFVALYRRGLTFDSPAHLRNWLRKAAVHRAFDHRRRLTRRRELPLEATSEPAVEGEHADPWLRAYLRSLIVGLPQKLRVVVVLRYQEDMQPAEIAAVLDLPVNTVKSRLQRALVMLRSKIGAKVITL
jgi:RNA polymerase sigma-70 factor (ECF subfamily)